MKINHRFNLILRSVLFILIQSALLYLPTSLFAQDTSWSDPPPEVDTSSIQVSEIDRTTEELKDEQHKVQTHRTQSPKPVRSIPTDATTISSAVSGTWTLSESPYIVTGHTIIGEDEMLIIEAGVEVRFTGAYTLTVYGDLQANGTASAPILFTSHMESPEPGDWVGIEFYNAGVDDFLKHTHIEFAEIGVHIRAVDGISSPVIEHSEITNNLFEGIKVVADADEADTTVSPQILTSTISHNGTHGIEISAYGGGSEDNDANALPLIQGNSILKNGSSGIYLFGRGGGKYSAGVVKGNIQDNEISNNGIHGIHAYGYGGSWGCFPFSCGIAGVTNPHIDRNLITQNADTGIFLEGDGRVGSLVPSRNSGTASPLITNNRIVDNGLYGLQTVATISADNADPQIINNVIAGHSQAGILSAQEVYSPTFTIYNNLILSNGIGFSAAGERIPEIGCNNLWQNDADFFNYPSEFGRLTQQNANGDPSDLSRNIFLEPLVVDESTHDYHIDSASPLVDAGCELDDVPAYDIDQDIRPQGITYDIGVDEVPDDSDVARIELTMGPSCLLTWESCLQLNETVTVTATVIGKDGGFLPGQSVDFSSMTGIRLDNSETSITDERGQVAGQFTSIVTGTMTITASADYRSDSVTLIYREGPPKPPTELTVSAKSDSELELTWQDNTWDESEYQIERSFRRYNEWETIATVGPDQNRYMDGNLDCLAYYYRVRAYRARDDEYSTYSDAVRDESQICIPINLTATLSSQNRIQLTWEYPWNTSVRYHIERALDGVAWSEQRTTYAPNYTEFATTCGTQYRYRVRAFDSQREAFSSYSSIAEVKTDSCPPIPPSNLRLNPTASFEAQLQWDDDSTDESAFHIERRVAYIGEWQEIGITGPDVSDYLDPVPDCETYEYRVRVYRATDEIFSEYSPLVIGWGQLCPPTSVEAMRLGESATRLTWRHSLVGVYTFSIERSEDLGDSWEERASTISTFFTDTSLNCRTTYQYRIRVWSSADEVYSPYSEVVSAVTAQCILLPPDPLTISVSTSTTVTLNWIDPSEHEAGFSIERRLEGTEEWSEIYRAEPNVTHYTDQNLNCSSYQYRVRAIGMGVDEYSGYSNIVTRAACLPVSQLNRLFFPLVAR